MYIIVNGHCRYQVLNNGESSRYYTYIASSYILGKDFSTDIFVTKPFSDLIDPSFSNSIATAYTNFANQYQYVQLQRSTVGVPPPPNSTSPSTR